MRVQSVVVAVVLAASSAAWAGESRRRPKAETETLDLLAAIAPVVEALSGATTGTEDAPRLLTEALRTGTTDAQAWASIVRWILNEKEETVAAGLVAALGSVPAARGGDAARWDATTAAVLGAFQAVLRDAQANRRQDGERALRHVARAAAPAVVAALKESDPAARASALRTLEALVAASPELRAAIEGADADVREAMQKALEEVRPEADPPSPPSPAPTPE